MFRSIIKTKMNLSVLALVVVFFTQNANTLDGCVVHDGDILGMSVMIYCQNYVDLSKLPDLKRETDLSLYIQMREIQDSSIAIQELKEKVNFKNYGSTNVEFTDTNIDMLLGELLLMDIQVLIINRSNIPIIHLNVPYGKFLYALRLRNNHIKELDAELFTFSSTTKLIELDLSFNEISNVPANCFYSTRTLKLINLSHNQISNFDYYAFTNLLSLEELNLSHNKLINLGIFLYPVRNLKTLWLNNNQITALDTDVFNKSTLLKELYLSHNNITLIEDKTFGVQANLQYLDLSHNKISSINEVLLRNNTGLARLDVSYNNINFVEPGMFSKLENLRNINFQNAFAIKTIKEPVFMGLQVKSLNFSGSTITRLLDRPFLYLGNHLQKISLRSCAIQEISKNAFDSLIILTELDLSNNQLSEITFETIDLENLSKLYLNNNYIQELKPETFQHLVSLTQLDISNNKIRSISPMTFKNLKNLKTLNIINNTFDNPLQSNTFYGLDNIAHLELINTRVERWDSYSFTGLKSLKVLNASHGHLSLIEFQAFAGISNLEILDISHNMLMSFNVKLLHNKNMEELYLNDNQIINIRDSLFEGLNKLKILKLSNNYLTTIIPIALKPLKSLVLLDLSNNSKLTLSSESLSNLPDLKNVLLPNTGNQTMFESVNITIKTIDLSSSSIYNLNLLHIQNVTTLEKLDLSMNNITFLDHNSLGVMPSVWWLNLSQCYIDRIHPGTFIATTSIEYLDLSYNKLVKIEYGALNGLKNLKVLNLSNNAIKTFSLSQSYFIPAVTEILLDNNQLFHLNLPEYNYKCALKTLSVGGNELSCEDILDLKLRSKLAITADSLDFLSENIDGVKCTPFMDEISAT